MNEKVDNFIKKSKHWNDEMKALRAIMQKTKLEEDMKWGQPCYTHGGSNIVIIQPFKSYLGLMFFKGSLLKDPKKALVDNGPNSQAARRFEFQSLADVKKQAATIKAYVKEAIALEESGEKVVFKAKPAAMPEELKKAFSKSAKLKKAFEALTPGRQRAYLMHFSGAKQAATREARITKCTPDILAGKGLNER